MERPKAIAWLAPEGEPVLLLGEWSDDPPLSSLVMLRGEQPVLRRAGERMVILLPVAARGRSGHVAWLFDRVPPVTDLPGLVEDYRALAPAFVPLVAEGAPRPTSGLAPAATLALSRLATARRWKARALAQTAADACVEVGLARAAILLTCRPKGISGRPAASDRSLEPLFDEIRDLVSRTRPEADARPAPRRVSSDDLDAAGFDTALLGKMMGAKSLLLDLPPQGLGGVAIILVDPAPDAHTQGLVEVMALALRQPARPEAPVRAKLLRAAAGVAAAGLVVWLALPAPLTVTATALTRATHGRSVALPFDAYVSQMNVSVGQRVTQGDAIADLTAPDLEEQRTQFEFQASTEATTAQAALSQNNYGAYTISQQKYETLARQIAQIDARLAQAHVTAPVSGVVVATLGNDSAGRHVPVGTEIVQIQPDDDFSVSLNLTRVDAPLIAAGQGGEVFFRGLADTIWPLKVTTPVSVQRDPRTGEESLVASAHIEAPGNGRLFVGLTGFARMDAGQTIRAFALSRYVVEFIKVKAWTYLGWHL